MLDSDNDKLQMWGLAIFVTPKLCRL